MKRSTSAPRTRFYRKDTEESLPKLENSPNKVLRISAVLPESFYNKDEHLTFVGEKIISRGKGSIKTSFLMSGYSDKMTYQIIEKRFVNSSCTFAKVITSYKEFKPNGTCLTYREEYFPTRYEYYDDKSYCEVFLDILGSCFDCGNSKVE